MIAQISNPNVKLHAPFQGANNAVAAEDYSNSAHTLTFNGGAKISTAQSYYNGGSSLYLDGDGDYVTISDSADFDLSGGSYTIKLKFYASAISGTQFIIGQNESASSGEWEIYLNSSGKIVYAKGDGTSSTTGVTTVTALTWHDLIVVWNGTNCFIYYDDLPIFR